MATIYVSIHLFIYNNKQSTIAVTNCPKKKKKARTLTNASNYCKKNSLGDHAVMRYKFDKVLESGNGLRKEYIENVCAACVMKR